MNRIVVSGEVGERMEFVGMGNAMTGRIWVIDGKEKGHYIVHEVVLHGEVAEEAKMGCMKGGKVVVSGVLESRKDGSGWRIICDSIDVVLGKRLGGAFLSRKEQLYHGRNIKPVNENDEDELNWI